MDIHEYLKSAEGHVWLAEDTAEVERILREIDRLAEDVVQLRTRGGSWDMRAPVLWRGKQ